MDKRHFLGATALAGLWPAAASARAARATGGAPGLLTVSGAIARSNRGPFDPALDQMLGKHGVRFDKAFVFTSAALRRLPAVAIKPTLEYDAKAHTLAGPLLTDVLKTAGVSGAGQLRLGLRAVDGYVAPITLAEARAWQMIVALSIDGEPLALGGLGPHWAVYDADRLQAFKDKPLKERFAACPWGVYSIEVAQS